MAISTKRGRSPSACSCINLRRAATAITEYYDGILRPSGLTLNQYSLLKNLKRLGDCSTSDLAAQVGLERTTLVRTINPLFQKGYIEDIAPKGARNRQIQVTPAGQKVLEICEPLWEKAQSGVASELGLENVQLLMDLLRKIEGL